MLGQLVTHRPQDTSDLLVAEVQHKAMFECSAIALLEALKGLRRIVALLAQHTWL